VWSYIIAAVIGALVGATDLASRYRDRPAVLVAVPSAWLYALLNAAAAGLALLIVNSAGWTFGATETTTVNALRIMAARLSAMAVFRSSFLTVRLGDTDVAVGPATLLNTLLGIADRSVDRRRAADRSATVTRIMAGISFERSRLALPTFVLALMQNVPPAEQHDLGVAVEALSVSRMSDTQKAYALGLLLMNIAGPAVVADAVAALRKEIGPEAAGQDPE
jgi:hypothetical protein